eukprot:COSAG01_NODE_49320_length_373_cov_0.762774_1_plen_54_part_01
MHTHLPAALASICAAVAPRLPARLPCYNIHVDILSDIDLTTENDVIRTWAVQKR